MNAVSVSVEIKIEDFLFHTILRFVAESDLSGVELATALAKRYSGDRIHIGKYSELVARATDRTNPKKRSVPAT